jgi:triosephosphate isomerase
MKNLILNKNFLLYNLSMPGKFFVANFKMNKDNAEAAEYFKLFPKIPADFKNTVVFCPPFTAFNCVKGGQIKLGAQNIHHENSGAFTGEISAKMVASCGAQFVILGHSERRTYFGETDDIINKKVKTAIANGLTVILCISNINQILPALDGVGNTEKVILAYEPLDAIGSGHPATAEQIAEISKAARKILPSVRLLYGGSVDETNADNILSIGGIDGVLVGSACLDPRRFAKICGIIS